MINITGASDDLIEVDGEISEEFNCYDPAFHNKPVYMAISDGTLLKITYDEFGIWRITIVVIGTGTVSKREGDVITDRNDIVSIENEGGIKWLVLSSFDVAINKNNRK